MTEAAAAGMELMTAVKEVVARFDRGDAQGEAATKMALVLPVLSALGWNPFNPEEVIPEYSVSVQGGRPERVDYALCARSEVDAVIECKQHSRDLAKEDESQASRVLHTRAGESGNSHQRHRVAVLHRPRWGSADG